MKETKESEEKDTEKMIRKSTRCGAFSFPQNKFEREVVFVSNIPYWRKSKWF